MGLLSPWFLAGFAALSLPVWLHLLRRRHSPPREFSSLMLFERRIESSIRRRRLRYLSLLALRCLLLAALALAFARPYKETAAVGAGDRLVVLALDESFSMRQGDRMARAKAQAMAELARRRAGERIQVVAFASRVRLAAEASRDPGQARAAIESLEAGDSRSSYGELARVLRVLGEGANGPVEAHVFTDLQRSSLPPGYKDLALPANLKLVLHAAADGPVGNRTVEAVNAPPRVWGPAPVRVQATLAAFGAAAAPVRASLVIEGRRIASQDVALPAGGHAVAEFTVPELRHGANRGEVRIESPDAFSADDRRRFVIERSDPLPALFVHEAHERRAGLYFRTALEASPQNAFRLEEASVEQAAQREPARYAFVVLSDVGRLPESLSSALRAYLERGGAVWITLGPSAVARGRAPLLEEPVAANGLRGGFQTAWDLDAAHPALARAGRWEGVKFYQAVHMDPGQARVLARLADHTPVLMERKVGAGRLLIFASTFDNLANDFPLHAAFVPFIERTAAYLAGVEQQPNSLTVDEHLSLTRAAESGAAAEVIGPDGRRALSLAEAVTAQSLPLLRAGYYEVRRGNGRNQSLAVNPDPRESDLDLIPADTLDLWRNSGAGPEAAASAPRQEQARREWWRIVLLAALALAAAESLAANTYLKGQSEGT